MYLKIDLKLLQYLPRANELKWQAIWPGIYELMMVYLHETTSVYCDLPPYLHIP